MFLLQSFPTGGAADEWQCSAGLSSSRQLVLVKHGWSQLPPTVFYTPPFVTVLGTRVHAVVRASLMVGGELAGQMRESEADGNEAARLAIGCATTWLRGPPPCRARPCRRPAKAIKLALSCVSIFRSNQTFPAMRPWQKHPNLALSTQPLSSHGSQAAQDTCCTSCHAYTLWSVANAGSLRMCERCDVSYTSPFLFGSAGGKKKNESRWLFVDLSRLPIRDARFSEPGHCW